MFNKFKSCFFLLFLIGLRSSDVQARFFRPGRMYRMMRDCLEIFPADIDGSCFLTLPPDGKYEGFRWEDYMFRFHLLKMFKAEKKSGCVKPMKAEFYNDLKMLVWIIIAHVSIEFCAEVLHRVRKVSPEKDEKGKKGFFKDLGKRCIFKGKDFDISDRKIKNKQQLFSHFLKAFLKLGIFYWASGGYHAIVNSPIKCGGTLKNYQF